MMGVVKGGEELEGEKRLIWLLAGAAGGALTALAEGLAGGMTFLSFSQGFVGVWLTAAVFIIGRRRSGGETLRVLGLFLGGLVLVYFLGAWVRGCVEDYQAVQRMISQGRASSLAHGGTWRDWMVRFPIGELLGWLLGACAVSCWGGVMCRYRGNRAVWLLMGLVPVMYVFAEGLGLFAMAARQGVGGVSTGADLICGAAGLWWLILRKDRPRAAEEDAPEVPEEEELPVPTEEEKWLL